MKSSKGWILAPLPSNHSAALFVPELSSVGSAFLPHAQSLVQAMTQYFLRVCIHFYSAFCSQKATLYLRNAICIQVTWSTSTPRRLNCKTVMCCPICPTPCKQWEQPVPAPQQACAPPSRASQALLQHARAGRCAIQHTHNISKIKKLFLHHSCYLMYPVHQLLGQKILSIANSPSAFRTKLHQKDLTVQLFAN